MEDSSERLPVEPQGGIPGEGLLDPVKEILGKERWDDFVRRMIVEGVATWDQMVHMLVHEGVVSMAQMKRIVGIREQDLDMMNRDNKFMDVNIKHALLRIEFEWVMTHVTKIDPKELVQEWEDVHRELEVLRRENRGLKQQYDAMVFRIAAIEKEPVPRDSFGTSWKKEYHKLFDRVKALL